MKKLLILLFAAALLSGCYTTFYPTVAQQIGDTAEIPDSTKQIIINNYYESNEYYQVPHRWRYSLLWDSYYWDPFYYDYSYYHWQPYYWYGSYYYYNPYNHYWYYYPPSYYYGGGGENHDQERIRKPGYQTLMSTSGSAAAPFVSVGSDNGLIGKPGKRSEIDINSGVGNNTYSPSPRIESVGKSSATDNNAVYKSGDNTSTYKPSTTNDNSKKSSTSTYSAPKSKPSTSTYSAPKSSSTSSPKSKPSRTTSSSGKSSSTESSTSKDKK